MGTVELVTTIATTYVIVTGSLFLYAAPTLVAIHREHRNLAAVAVVNVFLGWSLVGWVVALVMAVAAGAGRVTTPGRSPRS